MNPSCQWESGTPEHVDVRIAAGHAGPMWLPIERLYLLSSYTSHMRSFRASLVRALERLKSPETPDFSRVTRYFFSKDATKIWVVRRQWNHGSINAPDV